jgi:hypothetical protein
MNMPQWIAGTVLTRAVEAGAFPLAARAFQRESATATSGRNQLFWQGYHARVDQDLGRCLDAALYVTQSQKVFAAYTDCEKGVEAPSA